MVEFELHKEIQQSLSKIISPWFSRQSWKAPLQTWEASIMKYKSLFGRVIKNNFLFLNIENYF